MAVTLATSGTTGAWIVTSASAAFIASAAGAISAQWKGAETGSITERFAPASFASPTAFSTAAFAPEITTCAGSLSFAAWQTPASAACAAIAATAAKSRPRIAAMAPSPTGTAACIALPRSRSSLAVSPTASAPAAASAEYSPRECPATKAPSAIATPSA